MLKIITAFLILLLFAGMQYRNNDFGKEFQNRFAQTCSTATKLQPGFELCSKLAKVSPQFMSSIVFPELMRYSQLKDGIESESLKVLYVQLGQAYADFSIGPFQMKPSFAERIEQMSSTILPDSISKELNFFYESKDSIVIRQERINRLLDPDWQHVYLTAFVLLCDQNYSQHPFKEELEKMQWYAAVYNAGFDKTDNWIEQRIKTANKYLEGGMPGNKFNYIAIATHYFQAHQ